MERCKWRMNMDSVVGQGERGMQVVTRSEERLEEAWTR